MITTAEIQKKAEQLYPGILKATITGEVVFPKNIRSDKSLAKDFAMMSREIAHIMADSKDRKGFGYRVVSEQVKHRQHGVQDIPKAIVFETRDDYLRYTGKVKEFQQFQHNLELILSTIPILKDWCFKNPLSIIHEAERWPDILKVCQWFMSSHEINRYYIRELPISVHTKFIETNIGIFRSLLDELLPHLSNIQENVFQKRFQLKYQQPLIRIRFLDAHIAIDNRFSDVSIPLNDFAQANFDCQNLLITENLMTFLTLPPLKNTIAIWGGGYAVKNLQCIEWLKDKHLFYWGDIDIHGDFGGIVPVVSVKPCHFKRSCNYIKKGGIIPVSVFLF